MPTRRVVPVACVSTVALWRGEGGSKAGKGQGVSLRFAITAMWFQSPCGRASPVHFHVGRRDCVGKGLARAGGRTLLVRLHVAC